MCDGLVSLAAAQFAIARDWLIAESKLGLGGGGGSGGGSSGAWCKASASYNATYGDYGIHAHSNQPDAWATATASNGASHGYWTDGSGYVDIFLRAASGDTVTLTVSAADELSEGNAGGFRDGVEVADVRWPMYPLRSLAASGVSGRTTLAIAYGPRIRR